MQITFNPLDPQEADAIRALLLAPLPAGCVQATPQEVVEPPQVKRIRKTKAEPAPVEVVEPQPQDVSKVQTETLAVKKDFVESKVAELPPERQAKIESEAAKIVEETKKTYTKDDVRSALLALADKKGQDEARRVMAEVGKAAKLSDIQPAMYADVIRACEA